MLLCMNLINIFEMVNSVLKNALVQTYHSCQASVSTRGSSALTGAQGRSPAGKSAMLR